MRSGTMARMAKAGGAVLAGLLVGLSARAADTVTYFHNDLAGSPMAATDENRVVLWKESYRPYGERRINSAAAQGNQVWFASRRQDAETGLVYMGARYYDPVVGRFLGTDPNRFEEGSIHSFNRYSYANNNPYKYVDPDGRQAFLINVPPPTVASGVQTGTLGKPSESQQLRSLEGFVGTSLGGLSAPVFTDDTMSFILGGFAAIVADRLSNLIFSEGSAAATRAENVAKGIPESVLGPSGKPKIHIVDHGGKVKEAEEAARREVGKGGTTELHSNPSEGRPHFHGVDSAGGKDRVHHEFDR